MIVVREKLARDVLAVRNRFTDPKDCPDRGL
jgi:hypothetical protein